MVAGSIASFLASINFFSLERIFFANSYYDVLFPFLLIFAFMYTILGHVKIFKSKKTGHPFKSIIFIISLVISFYAVTFQTYPGYTVGKLMMMLFPNISALTMGILALYIVGSIFGKNFFKGLFSDKYSAIMYMAVGGLGLITIIFYVGIVMGFWNFSALNQTNYWNFVIAGFLLVLGIIFLIIDLIGIGVLFLFVFISYVLHYGQGNILSYFVDPVVYIMILVIVLLSWLNSDKELKSKLEKDQRSREKNMAGYEKEYGRKLNPYESRIYDLVKENYARDQKKLEKLYEKMK